MSNASISFSALRFYFFLDRDKLSELFLTADSSKLKISEHHRRLGEQKRLVSSGEDFSSLKRAMQAFKSLQHIKVLKVQDETERELLQFIERHDNPLDPLVSLDWKPQHAPMQCGLSQ